MVRAQYHGYNFRSKQPCIPISLSLSVNALGDTTRIDRWLLGTLVIEPERIRPYDDTSPDPSRAIAAAVINRALVLYGELLRAGAYPQFDDGRLLSIKPIEDKPGCLATLVSLPVIDNLPTIQFGTLFSRLVELILVRFAEEPTPEAADVVFAELDRVVVQRLKQGAPFTDSTLAICQLAFQQGVPFRHIGNGMMLLGWGARAQIMRGSSILRDSAIGAQICHNKELTASTLRTAGLPSAEHVRVGSHGAALDAARELGWPVVVKPADLERSEGVTANIASEADLLKSYDLARALSPHILVERQVPGVCHRIFVANGQLIYAVRRLPKGLVGNGRDTVEQLVAAANEENDRLPPWKRLRRFPLDDMALACLAEQGLSTHSVVALDQHVFLRSITSGEWGGIVENLSEEIHADNVELAISVARTLGITVAGVDVMSTDISRPWYENGAVIIEVNFKPQFATHFREAEASRLIPALVEGDGRIPVHLVAGHGDLLGKARQLQRELSRQGTPVHLTSALLTEDGQGREIRMMSSTLLERSLALLVNPDVNEFILVGEPVEVLRQGLAVDRLESAHVVDSDIARGEQLANELCTRFQVLTCHRPGRPMRRPARDAL